MTEPQTPMPPALLKEGLRVADRYEIEALLGTGGMAAVYRARDTLIDRPVALKVLSILGNIHDPEVYKLLLARFEREAKVAARIRHANAVTIFDMGVTEETGHPFIVMDLIEGHDLDEELSLNGPMKPQRAMPLFMRCLEALAEGHKQGIVHKDLKPSNLMLNAPGTEDEDMLVLDFGVAGLSEQSDRLTSTGQILGTPQYLSPEYIQDRIVTPALDVYQMGLILCEMLSGEPVIKTNNPMKSMMTHIENTLELPNAVIRSPLGPVLAGALEPDHTERYKDAGAFHKALSDNPEVEAWLKGSAMVATPVIVSPMPPDTGAWQQPPAPDGALGNPPRMVLLAAGLFLVVAVGLSVFLWFQAASDKPVEETVEAPMAALDLPAKPEAPPEEVPSQDNVEAVEPIEVLISTRPASATVSLDGESLEEPWVVRFESAESPGRTIKISARGHKPQEVLVTPGDAPDYEVVLRRKKITPRVGKDNDKKPTRSVIAN